MSSVVNSFDTLKYKLSLIGWKDHGDPIIDTTRSSMSISRIDSFRSHFIQIMRYIIVTLQFLLLNGTTPVGIHLHSETPAFDNPRVLAIFMNSDQSVAYSMMFDTGSPLGGHILAGDAEKSDSLGSEFLRIAGPGEGYIDTGKAPEIGGSRDLVFGGGDSTNEVTITKAVGEVVMLLPEDSSTSPFCYSTAIELASHATNGVGLVGAAYGSQFASKAGVFAYAPIQQPTPSIVAKSYRTGYLVIGEQEVVSAADKVCIEPLTFISNDHSQLEDHWIVPASMKLGGQDFSFNWMIDTGAAGYFLPEAPYQALLETISSKGGVTVPNGGNFALITNCDPRAYPPIEISIGNRGSKVFTVTIDESDYIVNFDPVARSCLLTVTKIDVYGGSIIGMGILSTIMAVFDHRNDRMGFCHKRSSHLVDGHDGPIERSTHLPDVTDVEETSSHLVDDKNGPVERSTHLPDLTNDSSHRLEEDSLNNRGPFVQWILDICELFQSLFVDDSHSE